ncbi:MAG: MBL fold metallo-hydrolase [Firmicutes bacterium]|nr:MBL fold metallo-hydrolase [Bacillota bacterium]
MRITSLLENTTQHPSMYTEHGLSLYIETSRHKILFDMGQTDLFARNADTLGIDLAAVDIAILSHGHYDHGGGLSHFLQINQTAPIYLQRSAFSPHYNGTDKYIGLEPQLANHPRLHFIDDSLALDEELTLFSCNKKSRPHSLDSFGLKIWRNGQFLADPFEHEHYLLIQENQKRVLISGCSHKGILDIQDWFHPDVFVGGFHLMKLDDTTALHSTATHLNQYPTQYYTCHCTGNEQYNFLRQYMPHLHYLSCGDQIYI